MYAVRREEKELCYREIPDPKLLSNTDVIIKVEIAGLCRTDKNAAQGKLKLNPPITLGHEFSGFIEEKGIEVQGLARGERVSCFPVIRDIHGRDLFMGVDYDGAFARYVRVSASQVHPIPDTISFKQGAYLEPITASLAPLNLSLNKTAVGGIWGNNRIALLTLRILELAGYSNLTVIDSNNADCFKKHFDYLIETDINDDSIEKMIEALKPKGKLVLKSRPSSNISFPVRKIVQNEIQLLGVNYGNFEYAIQLLVENQLFIDDLFGLDYPLSQATKILADESESEESKKIFFTID